MKKLLYILLALVVVLAFAGCSSTDDDDIRGNQIVEKNDEAEENEDKTTESEEDMGPALSMGEVEGLTYENKYIGLGCKLDSGWTFYTDEQIKEMNEMTDVDDDDWTEAINNATVLIDMMAVNETTASSLMVSMEKSNALSLTLSSMDQILDNVMNSGESSLKSSGFTVLSKNKTKCTVDGKEFDAVVFESEMQGIKVYQTMVLKKCKSHLASFTITSYNEDISADMLKLFYEVK